MANAFDQFDAKPQANAFDQFDQQAVAPVPVAEPAPTQDWSSLPGNIPASAGSFISNISQAVTHPVDTLKNLGNLAIGTIDKAASSLEANTPPEIRNAVNSANNWVASNIGGLSEVPTGGVSQMPGYKGDIAEKVGQFYVDRYGSLENAKQTLINDPVGAAADLSAVLSLGGAAASRIPGLSGKVAETLSQTGRAVDPFSMAGKVVSPVLKATGKGASELIGGLGTQTGGESLRLAAKAGYAGGQKAEDFTSAMRGRLPMEKVVSDAKMALNNMKQSRSQAYRSGMADISKDKTILDFKPIDQAVKEVRDIGTFKGKAIAKSTNDTMKQIQGTIDEWKKLNPAEYHTPEGLDALKQSLGDIRDATEYGSRSRLMADKAYKAVKNQIVEQAPEYAKVMKGYEEGSKLIKEIEKSLSLGEKATADTALRKLQSVLRDNVNTNYGRRGELAQTLVESGAPNLMEQLSGQALSSVTPRGLGKLVASGLSGAGLATMNPALLAPILMQSPRLMGEASYLGGKTARGISGAQRQLEALLNKAKMTTKGTAAGAFQAGRLEENK